VGRARKKLKLIQAPSPEMWSETIPAVRRSWRRSGVACFWATSLEKVIGGVTALISFRLTWDGCRSEACYSFGRKHGRHRAVKRRQFISLLGGTAVAWPIAALAEQGERMRRIGVLIPGTANDSEFQTRLGAFLQALALLGWDIGRNVSIDTRWATSNTAEVDRHARELAALAPDVILANGSVAAAPLLQATRTVPIVFAIAADPVGAGLVDSLARPGGNATGFITFEYGISAKWLELLKEIAPGVKQVAVFRDPDLALGAGQFGAMQSVAPSFELEVRPVDVRDAPAIERAITGFASTANGGLIVTGSAAAVVHRELIVRLAAQHKPAASTPPSAA
jgi:putative tryptophan/tyrosine transport system substrate-binding protein